MAFTISKTITDHFQEIYVDFERFNYLTEHNNTRVHFIQVVEAGNKIIADMETHHLQIIQEVLGDNNFKTRTEFSAVYNIRVEVISTFKFHGYNIQELKQCLNYAIDDGFKKITMHGRR